MADPTAVIMRAAMLCDHRGMTAEGTRMEQPVADDLLGLLGEWAARGTADLGDDTGRVPG